jgi:hypothetical protein
MLVHIRKYGGCGKVSSTARLGATPPRLRIFTGARSTKMISVAAKGDIRINCRLWWRPRAAEGQARRIAKTLSDVGDPSGCAKHTCSDLQTSGRRIANIRPTGARSLQMALGHKLRIIAIEPKLAANGIANIGILPTLSATQMATRVQPTFPSGRTAILSVGWVGVMRWAGAAHCLAESRSANPLSGFNPNLKTTSGGSDG